MFVWLIVADNLLVLPRFIVAAVTVASFSINREKRNKDKPFRDNPLSRYSEAKFKSQVASSLNWLIWETAGNVLLVYSALFVPKSRDIIYWKGFSESLAGLLLESFESITKHNNTCPCNIPSAHVSGHVYTFHILFPFFLHLVYSARNLCCYSIS